MTVLQAYLAGPDVFKPNPMEVGNAKKETLAKKNITGLYPMDPQISNFQHDKATGRKIFAENVALINKSHVILANMTNFHGPSMDVGTATELAYGAAMGKLVIGYYEKNDEEKLFTQRVIKHFKGNVTQNSQGDYIAPDGTTIEDFKETDNLMIPGFIAMSGGEIYDSFEEAVTNIHNLWSRKQQTAN